MGQKPLTRAFSQTSFFQNRVSRTKVISENDKHLEEKKNKKKKNKKKLNYQIWSVASASRKATAKNILTCQFDWQMMKYTLSSLYQLNFKRQLKKIHK